MSGPVYRDPWAKNEAWRKHPMFSKRAQLKAMFPGFGIAVVLFTGYVVADNLLHPTSLDKLKKEAAGDAHGPTLMGSLFGKGKKEAEEGH